MALVYKYFNLAPQGEQGYTHTTNIIGALNGVNSAGAIIGCIISAWSADAYSRKRTIQLGCIILIIGGALCAGAANIGMFLAGRVIAGIGSGILAGQYLSPIDCRTLLNLSSQSLFPCIKAKSRRPKPVAP